MYNGWMEPHLKVENKSREEMREESISQNKELFEEHDITWGSSCSRKKRQMPKNKKGDY